DAVVQAVAGDRAAELAQNQARLYPRPAFLRVYLMDPGHSWREVHDDGVIDGLAGQAGTTASGQDRYASLRRRTEDVLHIHLAGWEDDSQRHHLVDGGVGGVEHPGGAVRTNLPLQVDA